MLFFFFSSRRRHTRCSRDWSSDVCSSDLLRCALRELLGGVDPTERVVALRHLKEKVLRLEFAPGTPWRSVVVKRLEPAVAQRNQLVATRWLPTLGLGDRCARLLGVAADRGGRSGRDISEDLGEETLADRKSTRLNSS